MSEQIQARLDAANQALAGILPYSLEMVNPKDIELLKKNARFMRNDVYRQLVDNVKREKALESVPLIYRGPDVEKPIALSGNHRVMAARDAGLKEILCLVITKQISEEERVAKQLSHNAIAGQDDLQVLKDLYDSIQDLNLKAYSGIDEELRKQLANIKFSAISEPRLAVKTVSFLFLPREVDLLKQVLEQVDKALETDSNYALMKRDYQEFFDALVSVKAKLKVKNSAAALMTLVRLGVEALDAKQGAAA